VRVIAGSAKGTRLAPVPAGTRPVSDRAREGVFSSLGEHVVDARVLDLYAGSGAMGIEALSRGAASAVFVDSAAPAIRAIRANLARAKVAGRARVVHREVARYLASGPGAFDLVLADPPYATPAADLERVLSLLSGRGVLAPGGLLVLTRPAQADTGVIPLDFPVAKRLGYGDTLVLISREADRARDRALSGDV